VRLLCSAIIQNTKTMAAHGNTISHFQTTMAPPQFHHFLPKAKITSKLPQAFTILNLPSIQATITDLN
jgi:hypothetical protein